MKNSAKLYTTPLNVLYILCKYNLPIVSSLLLSLVFSLIALVSLALFRLFTRIAKMLQITRCLASKKIFSCLHWKVHPLLIWTQTEWNTLRVQHLQDSQCLRYIIKVSARLRVTSPSIVGSGCLNTDKRSEELVLALALHVVDIVDTIENRIRYSV